MSAPIPTQAPREDYDDFPCCAPDKAALARIKHAIMSRIEAEQKAHCTATWSKTGGTCVCGWTTGVEGDIVGRVLEHLEA